jgi:hypothetical protein
MTALRHSGDRDEKEVAGTAGWGAHTEGAETQYQIVEGRGEICGEVHIPGLALLPRPSLF